MNRERKKWIKLIDKFIPHRDYDVADYYGVSMIKTKKSNKYRLKLIYDYGSNAVMSVNQIEVTSLKMALSFYEILDSFAKNKGEVENIDNIFDDIEEDEEIKEPW